jgi:hypothetical protein
VHLTGYAGVGCVFDNQAAITGSCADGGPRALAKRFDRARSLFARAGRTGRATIVRRAVVMVDQADQVRYRSAGRGTITPECSGAITRLVRRLQAGAARWQSAEPVAR